MKYLKLYEQKIIPVNNHYPIDSYHLDVSSNIRISLDGIEDFKNLTNLKYECQGNSNVLKELKNMKKLEHLSIIGNHIETLEGIENLTSLKVIYLNRNLLTNLKGIENLKNLNELYIHENDLENLKGIENLSNLNSLGCATNNLINLDELKNLTIRNLYCQNCKITDLSILRNKNIVDLICYNPLEMPIPYQLIPIMRIDLFSNYDFSKFKTYEYQKWFIEEHPEIIKDLEYIGFNKKIKEEYKELLDFFNMKY